MAMKELIIGRFTGGLNTRDAAGELGEGEIPDAMNVTIDDRGAAAKRLGMSRRYASAVGTGRVTNVFAWKTRGWLVSQIGTGMHVNNNAAFHTWTTNARVGMCEFQDLLVMIHPIDGMRVYDGTTVTTPTNAPRGSTVAAWQNKIWAAGDPAQPPRVYYSDIGSANRTNVNQFNDLREKDSSIITCLAGAAGLDISGRPGLLAFKGESTYRIYDSTNGAYNTIDPAVGCGSNIAATSMRGRVYTVSARGIYSTDGINPMDQASGKIENLFHDQRLNLSRPDLFAAGKNQDRLWFSVPGVGSTQNTLALEHDPASGWFMAHSNAAAAYASMTHSDTVLASPTTDGIFLNLNRGGSDDGVAIASYFQSYWQEPNGGNKVRIRRMRITGLGVFDVALFRDYEEGQSLRTLDAFLTTGAAIYDNPPDLYDAPGVLYGPLKFQEHKDFWSIGTCRAVSVRVQETSSATLSGRTVLGIEQPEQGAWILGHIGLLSIDLGFH